MELDDHVIVINRDDLFYGYKFIICGVHKNLDGKITGYTVHDGYGRHKQDYVATDVQYISPYRRRPATSQMQLL